MRKKQLMERVELLEKKVAQLEKENTSQLSTEFLALQVPEHAACHGPDNIHHFDTFSIDNIIDEVQKCAPNLSHLFKSLGKSSPSESELEEVRVATSLSILMKSRSVKVLGLQLLLTMMPVGKINK